jgi:flagellar motor switch protein FliN/FliY
MTVQKQLGKLATVRMPVEVQIGRTAMTIRELLQLRAGSLVSLEFGPGNDFEIMLGGVFIGEGEPIRLERKAGVRITRVLRAEDDR